MSTRGRVVLAKLGMDAHWRGIGVVARLLRDGGYEVIYLGHATADAIVATAISEDADVIGVSTLSGNHMTEVPRLLTAAAVEGVDAPIVVGGSISRGDGDQLVAAGAAAVFGPGTPPAAILDTFANLLAPGLSETKSVISEGSDDGFRLTQRAGGGGPR